MNHLRKLELLFISTLFVIGINAQRGMSKVPATPQIWHRPDSAIICPKSCDSISLPTSYTMMMVYKSLQPEKAQQLWKINRTDNKYYSISTHAMSTEKAVMPLRRTKKTFKPCIYTFQQTLKPDTSYQDITQLFFGTDNTQDTSSIILYEAAYFNYRLPLLQSLMFQTYLAIKNGITLDGTSYISTHGDTIWDARTDKGYYHHIKGIGSDSVYEFHSQKSSSLEDDVVSISCVDTLPYNSYALLGDDNAEIEWYAYENTTSMLQRTWKIKTTNNQQPIIICLNCDKVGDFTDTLHLALLNEEGEITQTIFPDSIDINKQYYYTIVPSLKQLYFSFTSTSETHNYSRKRNKGNHSSSQTNHDEGTLISDIKITLGPNPTYGEYSLNISLSQPTNILFTIQDPTGKTIVQQKLTDSSMYQYSGYLYSNGLYLFSFYSDNGRILSTQELLVY